MSDDEYGEGPRDGAKKKHAPRQGEVTRLIGEGERLQSELLTTLRHFEEQLEPVLNPNLESADKAPEDVRGVFTPAGKRLEQINEGLMASIQVLRELMSRVDV